MNVVNVNKIMHEEAKQYGFNVSPKAVKEYSGRIIDYLEKNVYQAYLIAKQKGRKTIMEDDIVRIFDKVDVEA